MGPSTEAAASGTTDDSAQILARWQDIRMQVARAARDSRRSDVTLIAVSKTVAAARIAPVLKAGQTAFGENYVQEAAAKWPELRALGHATELHLIGPLQSNKARQAVGLFDVIHTLDRGSLARELAREIPRERDLTGRTPRLLVQVNTGEEPQKGGVAPSDLPAFLDLCRETHRLAIDGLMCIPPVEDPPSPHFALLATLARTHALPMLSMGMSSDFEQAIMLGATHVRVGSAIFGARG
jgi:pyridoxal phosphate enzyme (YggS family)